MTKKLLVLAALFNFIAIAAHAQNITTAGVASNAANANTLAQILAGSGVTVTNSTLTGANNSCGTYGSGTTLGLNTGIILTTGQVANALAPNDGPGIGTDNGTAGDADLNNVLGSSSTQDAAVLEFDVVAIGNSLSFNYVFASDEYPEYVCSNFNDVFAFFITGPNPGGGNYTSQNIALIPGSGGLPVAINTVNPGTPGSSSGGGTCTSLAYSTYYNTNNTGTHEYDGFTDVFTAFAQVYPCSTYHLKLAIADVGDGSFDSGVFLEGNSFVSQGTTVTASYPAPFSTTYEGCVNGTFTFTLPAVATSNTTVNYTITGTATNGTDYTSIPGSILIPTGSQTGTVNITPTNDGLAEGQETVTVSILNVCDGTVYSTATININDQPTTAASANPTPICPNGTTTLSVSGTVNGMTYSWSPSTGVASPTSATTTATVSATQTYTVTLGLGTCTTTNSALVTVLPNPTVIATVDSSVICNGETVQLNANASGGTPGYGYSWSAGVSNSTIQNPTATPTSNTTYTVTATDQTSCTATGSVSVTVQNPPVVSIGNNLNLCYNQVPTTLSTTGGPYISYNWSTSETTSTISVSTPGNYSVTVYDGVCSATSNTILLTVFQETEPTLLVDTGMCPGETIILTADPGYTNVIWNTGATTNTIPVNSNGTFYYSALDVNGCPTTSDTVDVILATPPTVNASTSPDTICAGGTALLTCGAASGLTYLWMPGGQITCDISVTVPGLYIVQVTDAFCSTLDSVTVYQYAHAPVLLNNDTSVCIGESVTIGPDGGPYVSYTWSTGENTPTITTNVPGNYTVTVNDGNCNYVSDVFVLSNFSVTNGLALSDTILCIGQSFTITASPAGMSNFLWSDGSTSSSVTINSDGSYSFTAVDANGCPVTSDTADVSFVTPPIIDAQASPDTICLGGSSQLNSGAGAGYYYEWSNGTTTDTITVNSPGQYIVTVTAGACTSVDTVNVFQYPHAPVELTYDQSLCVGDSVVLIPSDAPYLTYVWNTGATTDSIIVYTPGDYWVTVTDTLCTYVSDTFTLTNYPVSSSLALNDTTLCQGQSFEVTSDHAYSNFIWNTGATTPSITVTTAGDYSYTATDYNGCPTQSDTATVTFTGPPVANITASPDSICEGGSSVLNSGAGSGLSYVWSPNGELTETITINTAGTYSVVVSSGNCVSSDTITIYQHTHAPVVLNSDTVVCPGASVVVVPSGAPYVTYNWSSSQSTPTITVSNVGSYWVTVNDGNCAYVSDTFSLTNFTVVNPTAYSDTSVCAGEPVILTGDGGYVNYTWNGTQNGQSITVTTPGDYTFTAVDRNGCSVQSNEVTVTNIALPVVNLTATPQSICVGAGSSTLNAGSQTGVTYTWSTTETTATIQVSQVGSYSVTADNAGCTATGTIRIDAAAPPVVSLQDVTSCCQSVVLDPANGQTLTYLWSDQSTDSTLTINTTENAFESYSVTVTNADGCSATAQSNVMIRCIEANAFATPDTILFGDSSQLNVTTAYSDYFLYNWSPATGLNNTTIQTPSASPEETTTYTVVVTDEQYECTDTAQVTVFVIYPDIVAIPNAFTPNRDGKNDVFYPVLLGGYQTVTDFRVYNRWGQLVHNSTEPWDGTFASKDQPAGTFIYYVIIRTPDPDNLGSTKDLKFEGSFSLLR